VAYGFDRNRCAAARKAAKVIKLKTQKGSERSKGRQHPTFEETERQAESVKRLIGPERSPHGSLIGQTPYPMEPTNAYEKQEGQKGQKGKEGPYKSRCEGSEESREEGLQTRWERKK
jgi:hypothetical protein